MPLADSVVRDGGKLHILVAALSVAAPTQATLDGFDTDDATMGNEVQRLSSTATAGTYTLSFDGEPTTTIAWDTTAANVQTKLEALPNISVGEVEVTGGPHPGTAIDVEFKGRYAGRDVPLMVVNNTGLTGTVTATQQTAASPWRHLGHTDLEEDVEFDEEGGDSEVRGSRQNPALRERVEPVTQFLVVNSIQVDADTLTYYFGEGTVTDGRFETNGEFPTLERSILLLFIDGTHRSGVWYPKASLRRGGPITATQESFRLLPIRITPLKATGSPLQAWIDDGIVLV